MILHGASAHPKLDADVVIVGSGLAGTVIARRLVESGASVIVLESGSLGTSGRWRITARGFESHRYPTTESYVDLHLRREVGGASRFWGGWCAIPRPVSFAPRSLGESYGWPIDLAGLRPSYEAAARFLRLRRFEFVWAIDHTLVEGLPIRIKGFDFSPPVRVVNDFAEWYRAADGVQLVTGATVERLLASPDPALIATCRARRDDGTTLDVGGKAIVLAAGAVGNAVLTARSATRQTIDRRAAGNAGSWLIEHPHLYGAFRCLLRPEIERAVAGNRGTWSGSFVSFTPPEVEVERLGIGDVNAQLHPIREADWTDVERALAVNYRALYGLQPSIYLVTVGMEQLPARANTVLNSGGSDSDGEITLRFGSSVARTFAATVRWFKTIAAQTVWAEAAPTFVAVGHLMGTTRMAGSPNLGVVDSDARVFGTRNLYVAGGSVMPTAGFANPTLTIIALACRLGELLVAKVR